MDCYLKRYWSLYLDFIDTFKDLNYKGFPLPLLVKFSDYIHNDIKREMKKTSFKQYLRNNIRKRREVQPAFEERMKTFTRPAIKRSGKIVLQQGKTQVLRFSREVVNKYFSRSNTIILESVKGDQKHLQFPVDRLRAYEPNVSHLIENHLKKAKEIIAAHHEHPVFGHSHFQKMLLADIPKTLKNLTAALEFLGRNRVSCVVVGTTARPESRILTAAARSKGIPVICMQHSTLYKDMYYLPVFATKQAVYGRYEKKWYKRRGVPDSCLTITGHPRYDAILTESHMSKRSFQKKLGLKLGQRTLLIATQPNIHINKWNRLIQLLKREANLKILIKPHPREIELGKLSGYKQLCTRYKAVQLVESDHKLYDILPHVDMVCVNSSAVGLEAMLFGKPAVIYKMSDFGCYDKLGLLVQSHPRKLAKIIAQLLHSSKRRRYAIKKRYDYLTYSYPQRLAGKQVYELIRKLSGKSK